MYSYLLLLYNILLRSFVFFLAGARDTVGLCRFLGENRTRCRLVAH